MSGVPYKFVILIKLPNSKFVTPALIVVTSLGLFKSLNVVPSFSNSYPLTYILYQQNKIMQVNYLKQFHHHLLLLPLEYTPVKSTPLTVLLILSLVIK